VGIRKILEELEGGGEQTAGMDTGDETFSMIVAKLYKVDRGYLSCSCVRCCVLCTIIGNLHRVARELGMDF